MASFDKRNGPPQTLLDALARLEKERAPRASPLLSQASKTKVWGADDDSDFSPPRLPWMSSSGSGGHSRRIASEGSISSDAWKSTTSLQEKSTPGEAQKGDLDANPSNASESTEVAATSEQTLDPTSTAAKEEEEKELPAPSSPRVGRIPLSARLAQAVGSRPTSPGTSRPSSPDQQRAADRNSHRRSFSASVGMSESETLNILYVTQLSNLNGVSDFGIPLAPGDQASSSADATTSTQEALSPSKRSSLFLSKSNTIQLSSLSDEGEEDEMDGNRALGPYPTSRRLSHLMS